MIDIKTSSIPIHTKTPNYLIECNAPSWHVVVPIGSALMVIIFSMEMWAAPMTTMIFLIVRVSCAIACNANNSESFR